MNIQWTPAQRRVIDSRGKNILVSAAAGSGKTAVLTERILAMLQEGEELKHFLVFTFTRASASDMKEKLRKRLTREVLKRNSPHLRKQLRELASSDISTIHAFCTKLLREYFFALDIDPAFQMGSQHQLDTVDKKVLDQLFEEEYAKRDPLFLELSTIFSSARGDEPFKGLLLSLREWLELKVDMEKSVDALIGRHLDKSFWRESMEVFVRETVESMEKLLREARSLSVCEPVQKLLDDDLREVENFSGFTALFWGRFPSGKKVKEEELAKDEIMGLRNRAKDIAKGWEKILGQWESFDHLFEEHLALLPRIEKLLHLTMAFSNRSFEERREMALLSFSDLERLSIELLKEDQIREEVRRKYHHVFVDEYQDTSELQEELIRSVSREDNCFMVGDIKQSIYRFRSARPEIFLEKYHRYKAGEESSERIDLSMNFRSAPPVIDAINTVFEQIMRRDFGGIDYDDDARLVFGNQSLGDIQTPIEVMLTPKGELSKEEEELHRIADKVAELHREGYSYGDIVVLFRSPAAYTEHASRIFRDKGIPLFLDSSEAYLGTLEVEMLLSGLRVVDNARLDIPLLTLLRLPSVGFSDQELYDIRQMYPRASSFHEAFWSPWEKDDRSEKAKKKEAFVEIVESLRRKSRFLSIDALLREIYRALDLETFLMTLDHPAQRLTNIRLLFLYARNFEETGGMGISGYLRYLENVRMMRSDYSAPRSQGDDRKLVRMMSIHRSKGLEFEAVIVGGLDRKYNERDFSSMVVTGEEGILMDFYDVELLHKKPHFFKRFIADAARKESRQEEIRLLYVAMSRAKKRLVLSSYMAEPEEFLLSCEEPVLRKLPEENRFVDLLFRVLKVRDGVIKTPGFVLSDPLSKEAMGSQEARLSASGRIPEAFVIERSEKKSKYSVTELTRRDDVDREPLLPLEPGLLTAKERGILFHKALQWLDFERLKLLEDLDEQLFEMEQRGIVVGFEEHELLRKFLSTEVGRLLIEKAPSLYKEVPFTMKKQWAGEEILVQGVIDLLILEDECTIIDYKTDRSLAYCEQYLDQVGIYQEAVETVLGRPVKDALVAFVRLDKVIRRE